ncbi:metal ABC transporter ATP-binding protein [Alkalimarinus coralli]|uniref:metal ABC transporter ATP-binding protein n=1 Tax=Alkalimarinus coralli TaxID=2935863 RepID=UPI00202AE592|nr:metal ABC transporter ATP-binding protein [Alkalimarinus coralli]
MTKASVTVESTQLVAPASMLMAGGQWHAIVGPNGGGKSTLLKTILGLMPHQGDVSISWPGNKKGGVGYMPQMQPFDRSVPISVLDYVLMSATKMPLWCSRKLPHSVFDVLERVRLTGLLDRKVGALSGGERQRLLLAVALLHSPSLLVLDEPLSGLDREGQEEMLSLLSEFNRQGGTIVMVEHDWQVVIDHCHQAYWIEGGLKAKGLPAEVFECTSPSTVRQPSDSCILV